MAVNLPQFIQGSLTVIGTRGDQLQADMDALIAAGQVNPEDLLQINFQLGQYNAMLEVTSSINKSIIDTIKSLAQRTG